MDRFIENDVIHLGLQAKYLKSNMDRFIEQAQRKYAILNQKFKIQYG